MRRRELTAEEQIKVAETVLQMVAGVPLAVRAEVDAALIALDSALRIIGTELDEPDAPRLAGQSISWTGHWFT